MGNLQKEIGGNVVHVFCKNKQQMNGPMHFD